MKFVLLIGPSSAGKSSICKEVKKQDSRWRVTSIDKTIEKLHKESVALLPQFVETNCPLLTKYMTDEEIKAVCFTGVLSMSKCSPPVTDLRFSSPKYQEAEEYSKATGLTGQELTEFVRELRSVGQFFEARDKININERLFDETFDRSMGDDDCVIIDIIPGNTIEETQAIINEFQTRAEAFRRVNGNRPVETYVSLAYCPPSEISKRVLERNKTPGEERSYLQGITQLQGVVKASPYPVKNNLTPLGHVSRTGMIEIAQAHETHLDPKTKMENALASGNRLARGLGMEDNQKIAHLVVPENLKVDLILNTADGPPDQLAKQVLDKTNEKPDDGNKLKL